MIGQQGVGRNFAHHVKAKTVFATLQTVAFHNSNRLTGFFNGANERHHQFHIRQAHFVTHELHGVAFHAEAFGKGIGDVARSTAEAQHGIFFFRFIAIATDQLTVFVALEVTHTHDDLVGPECGSNRCNTFSDLAFEEVHRALVAGRQTFNSVTQFTVHIRVVQHHLRVDTDIVVDDEF